MDHLARIRGLTNLLGLGAYMVDAESGPADAADSYRSHRDSLLDAFEAVHQTGPFSLRPGGCASRPSSPPRVSPQKDGRNKAELGPRVIAVRVRARRPAISTACGELSVLTDDGIWQALTGCSCSHVRHRKSTLLSTKPSASANPAFSVRVHVPERALPLVKAVVADAPGAVSERTDPPDATGAYRVLLDADSGSTLAWLTDALRDRLGADLLLCEDLVFAAASTGKLSLNVRAATATEHDVALLDADADRRVIKHLVDHPEHVNRFTGRAHRVALISDASAVLDFERLPAPAALPAVESQAVHLRRATGLDILPLPVAVEAPGDLATAVRLLAPGVIAAVLIHTRIDHVHAAQAALTDHPVLLLNSINDGLVVATAAAACTTLWRHEVDVRRARVVCVSANPVGDLGGLLLASGVTDLTFYDPLAQGIHALHELADRTDLIIDLFGLLSPPPGIPVLHARPETPPPFAAAATGPRPLHALPGLLNAAVATGKPVTARARIAAVRALIEQTQPGQTLPPLDHPGLTAAVTSAAVNALTRASGGR